MRKFLLSSLVSTALVFLCGCDASQNPIGGVALTANPDGTFGIGVTLKNGLVLKWDNVSPVAKERLVSRFPQIRAVQVSREVFDACGNRSRAIDGNSFALTGDAKQIARAVNATIKGDIAAMEAQLKEMKEIRKQTSSTAGMTIRRAFTPHCNCDAQIVAPLPIDTPVVVAETIPSTPLPSVDPGLPPTGIVPPPEGADKAVHNSLIKRVEQLEIRADRTEQTIAAIGIDVKSTAVDVKNILATLQKK